MVRAYVNIREIQAQCLSDTAPKLAEILASEGYDPFLVEWAAIRLANMIIAGASEDVDPAVREPYRYTVKALMWALDCMQAACAYQTIETLRTLLAASLPKTPQATN